jgi:acyl-coenzyme A thioesterase PaaI-like protein
MLAALADMAMGQALRSSSGDDEVPATSQLTVTYLRPGQPGRSVVTRGAHAGRELSLCEAYVEQDGRSLV